MTDQLVIPAMFWRPRFRARGARVREAARGVLLAGVLVCAGLGGLVFAVPARAGTYAAMTCADAVGNPIGAAGWAEAANASYVYSATSCATPGSQLGLTVGPDPNGYGDAQGGTLTYTVPSPLAITSYTLDLGDYARACSIQNGGCVDGYGHVWLVHEGEQDPSYDFQTFGGTAPGGWFGASSLSRVQSVTLGASCTAPSGRPCDSNAVIATASVSSGVFQISDPSVPTVSGVSGTLTAPGTLSGTQDIDFTAADSGSGIYSGMIFIDGTLVAQQILNSNGGLCHDSGQVPGERSFTVAQPCPAQVAATMQLQTAPLTDGSHHLQVLVDDAAGTTATVYDATITTDNHVPVSSAQSAIRPTAPTTTATVTTTTTTTTAVRPPAAACNGVCDSAPHLRSTAAAAAAVTRTRAFTHSALVLTGRLVSHTGSPIAGARVVLLARPLALGATAQLIATATTGATGNWTLRAPAGPSRVFTVGYREHLSDKSYATTLTYQERVSAPVTLSGPRTARIGHSITLRGALQGGHIPTGGELVAIEILYLGRWRTIDLLRTDSSGNFTYAYKFSGVPAGTYRFRAAVPANGAYPFAYGQGGPISVAVN